MVWLVASAVACLQLVFAHAIMKIAFFTEVKVKAVFAFVPDAYDGHSLTAVALHVLPDLLTGLYNHFNRVRLWIVSSYLEFFHLVMSGEITVLTHAEVRTVGTHETSTNNRSHVAVYTLVVVMGG